MIADHLLHLAHDREVQTANTIDVPASLADERIEIGNASSLEQPLVECAIEKVERLERGFVGTLALVIDDFAQILDELLLRQVAQGSGDLDLGGAPKELRFLRLADVDQRNARGASRNNIDEPLLGESQELVAHRGRADAEPLLKLLPVHRGARRQFKPD